MSFRRLSKASLRRYACSALSPMTWASAVSVISRGKLDVAGPIPEAGTEAVDGRVLNFPSDATPFPRHIGERLVARLSGKTNSPILSFSSWRRMATCH
jgi:hypothetical protein